MNLHLAIAISKGLLAAGSRSEREDAARELERGLAVHAAAVGRQFRVLADDLAQDAFFRVLQAAPPDFLSKEGEPGELLDKRAGAWLRTIVTRLAQDAVDAEKRKQARSAALASDPTTAPSDGNEAPDGLPPLDGQAEEKAKREMMSLVDSVVQHARQGIRHEEHREAFSRAVEELTLLAEERLTVASLIERRGIGRGGPGWKQAERRIHKHHSRARARIESAAKELAAQRALPEDDSARVIGLVQNWLKRCQSGKKVASNASRSSL